LPSIRVNSQEDKEEKEKKNLDAKPYGCALLSTPFNGLH
jgi:hypothetical protein